MKLHEIFISGYRGFKEFKITPENLQGLTVIAGQNGTGKSTILEIVAYLLNSHDIGQIRDINFFQGITDRKKAVWRVKVSFEEAEIDYIVKIIREEHPFYNQNKDRIKKVLIKDLKKVKDQYHFELELVLDKTYFQRDELFELLTPKFNGKKLKDFPRWFRTLQEKQIIFAQYIKPFENVGELSSTYFSSRYYDPEFLKSNTINIDLRNRNVRSNINVSTFLNRLATEDVFKGFDGKFELLDETLERINKVINPLIITYDLDDAKKGHLLLGMLNKKTNKSYLFQFASSGERQVIGMVSLLLSWETQPFKPIILIDEPEIHLHPEYVVRLADFFSSLFKSAENHTCIITTHSPEFIAENTDNVYQISSDSKSIYRVKGLSQRKKLLTSLGKQFDLAYLTPKIIFVEGEEDTKTHIADFDIYQKLIDPIKEKKVFIPASSKEEAKRAKVFADFFFDQISSISKSLKIYVLVDKDNQISGKSGVVFTTPFKCIENAFLMESRAFRSAYNKITGKRLAQKEFKELLNQSISQFGGTVYTTHGKKAFNVLVGKLGAFPGLSSRSMQEKILEEFNINNLPKRAKDFFIKLQKI